VAILELKTSWLETSVAAFRASPGRSSIAGGLVLILALAWGRVLIGGNHTPTAAQGATTIRTPASSEVTIAAMPPPQASGAEPDASLQQWAKQPIHPLARNPFAIPFDFYPHDGAPTATDSTSGTGYWDLVKKSMASRADQQEQRQILIDNVRIAAEALKLESTVSGAVPGAMVNGQLVREGSNVAGFHILKIQPRRVIVEREGVKLALMMD
jgi:hypothetical protein